MNRVWALTWVIVVFCAVTTTANAQIVAGKGEVAVSEAHFVAVREAQRTIFYLSLTVPEAAKGDFDVIVPVPASKEAPRAATPAEAALFSRLNALTAPRLVEYWEQDPCEFHTGGPDDGIAERDVQGTPPAPVPPAALSAVSLEKDVATARVALEGRGHTLSEQADTILDDYVRGGAQLAVASAPAGARSVHLRWVVDGPLLSVPVRLLSLYGEAPPRVVIDVLAADRRFEAANRKNLAAPANTDVKWGVKGSTDVFHDAVLAKLFAAEADAVVTEYAWRATSCAPCTGAPLDEQSLADLGVAGQPEVMIFTEGNVAAKPDGPPALRTALMACYAKLLAEDGGARGEVTVDVTIAGGKVSSASATGDSDALKQCAKASVEATTFDGAGASGSVRVEFKPLSRELVSNMVITRLRAQITDAKADVELRPGTPIAGGGEIGPTGGPKIGAYAATKANHFQSRYTVRHPWGGAKPTCLNPKTGTWGAPPAGVTPKPPGKALVDPAGADVEELLAGELTGVEALTMRFPPMAAEPTPKAAPDVAAAPPTPSASTPSASAAPESPAPTKAKYDDSHRPRWVGFLALGVCVLALWQSVRSQS